MAEAPSLLSVDHFLMRLGITMGHEIPREAKSNPFNMPGGITNPDVVRGFQSRTGHTFGSTKPSSCEQARPQLGEPNVF